MKSRKDYYQTILNLLFQYLLLVYLLAALINTVFNGVIKAYIPNMNEFIYILIFFGIISVLGKSLKKDSNKQQKNTGSDNIYILILSGSASAITLYKTQQIGIVGYMIALLTGLVIFVMSYLVKNEQ